MHRNDKQKVLKRTVLATAIGAVLLVAPMASNAAGMGKITVLSALGQPLRAELDITASREELGSLAARVAPVEAFRQANVEYASVLSTVRFTLDKHPDGKPYFKIQTDRAVNDPFIDFLVELSWSSGRLVREYAFLLDPPELKSDSAPVAVTAPVVQQPAESAAPADAAPSAEPTQPVPAKKESVAPIAVKKPKAASEASAAGEGEAAANTRKVKSGDTLGKIAAENAAEGVTLDQMLVALFNNNRDAFDGGNMNRLRAGKILTLPEADKLAAVSAGEAHKVVVAQSADFNAYRNSLAAAAAKQQPVEQSSQQASSGKITPKVEEKAAATGGQDKLQVSRSEAGAKTGTGKASEEDIVARDKALKEANSRIADLEKNLSDLKKLAELKSQAAADAQKAAQGAKATPAPAAAQVPNKPAEAPVDKGLAVTAVPPAVSSVAAAPAAAPAVSATAAAPADEMPKPKLKKKIVPPPPEPEPSFIDDNPLVVYGGGAALAAILGFLGFRTWKRKRDAKGQGITVSDLAASSVFGAASSQSIDTAAAPPTDFGHSTLDEIDTGKEGVDPIQEAEVYMAYGRDGQAEEILVDAMQKNPDNLPVLSKLLEIYAGRKSVPQFNTVANDLHQRSGGSGPEWEKAAALGRSLDPSNSLYGGGSAVASEPSAATSAEESMAATMIMEAPPAQEASTDNAVTQAAVEETPSVMDFDLDLGGAADTAVETPAVEQAPAAIDMDFDLDLGGGEPAAETTSASDGGLDINFDTPAPAAEAGNSIDFDIAASAPAPAADTPATGSGEEPALDFNFDLGDAGAPAAAETAPPLDLSSINLDLNEPASPPTASADSDSSEVATKLELAQAYEEMGDREGARELLQEVLAEGSPAQQEAARSKLDQLG